MVLICKCTFNIKSFHSETSLLFMLFQTVKASFFKGISYFPHCWMLQASFMPLNNTRIRHLEGVKLFFWHQVGKGDY